MYGKQFRYTVLICLKLIFIILTGIGNDSNEIK